MAVRQQLRDDRRDDRDAATLAGRMVSLTNEVWLAGE